MKQIAVVSGKGGTGKTSITAAFASLAKNAVFADCDVDAADLHLILKPTIKQTMPFHGLQIASIDTDICIDCKKCYQSCRFGAIRENITLIKESCEGCGVCAYVCPVDAIRMIERDSGFAYISDTRFGPMAHAVLNTAEEASGKLVTVVRNNAKQLAEGEDKDLILIDGPPGIGCPVIASVTGVDLVVIVTEPTLSAIHDMERVFGVTQHFGIPAVVCVNKSTINPENTLQIEQYCKDNVLQVVGKIPYDTAITEAMIHEQSIIEFSDGMLSEEIQEMWHRILERLQFVEDDFLRMASQLQQKIEYEEERTYSHTVIEEYRNPANFGVLEQPDAIGQVKGPCGDAMKITLKIVNEDIQDARFWTDGCGATIASGSMLMKMVIGKSLDEANYVASEQLLDALGGLPQTHHHCVVLAVNTLRRSLENYRKKYTEADQNETNDCI